MLATFGHDVAKNFIYNILSFHIKIIQIIVFHVYFPYVFCSFMLELMYVFMYVFCFQTASKTKKEIVIASVFSSLHFGLTFPEMSDTF